MSDKNAKRLRQITPAGSPKILSPPSTGSTNDATPVFCLHFLTGDFCLSNCQTEEKAAFAETLHKLSQLSWQQLTQTNRHKLGYEKIRRDSIRTSVPRHITADVDFFLAFRFDGRKPMVGYRSGATFHVLWLDRAFTLYPHD